MKIGSVAERLRVIRKDKNKKQTEMADLLKISYPSLVAYENGKTEPSFKMLTQLSTLNYNLNWLVDGLGPMRRDGASQITTIDANLLEELLKTSLIIIIKNKWNVEDDKLAKVIAFAFKEDCLTGHLDEIKLFKLLELVAT